MAEVRNLSFHYGFFFLNSEIEIVMICMAELAMATGLFVNLKALFIFSLMNVIKCFKLMERNFSDENYLMDINLRIIACH
jgi:hypothetical protein